MSDPTWVPLQAVYLIHDRQIARHGGAGGLRDASLLETGHACPQNKYAYEQADLMTCAAAYAFGIAKAHAFTDGNKRTAFVVAATFLRLNGYHLRPDRPTRRRSATVDASLQLAQTAFRDRFKTTNQPSGTGSEQPIEASHLGV